MTNNPSQFSPFFKEFFYQKLITPSGNNPVRNRAIGFEKIFELLDKKKRENPTYEFKILETGTMRADHGELNFAGDGCSAFIFDQFVTQMSGIVVSVDINPANCAYAKEAVSDRVRVVCSDSVPFLWSLPEDHKFDLIYLDSFDVVRDNPHPSAMHHVKELAAVINKNTLPGSIIAIDDADAFFDGGKTGKAMYVREFMDHIGATLVHDGYQLVWIL